MAVDENAAAGNVEEARNQVGESGLACAAGAYQRQHFAGAQLKIDVVQNLVFALGGRVGKADVLKLDGLRKAFQRNSVMPLFYIILGVKKAEDRGRGAHGLLKAVVEVSELAHRIVELEEQDDESAEHSHGHAPMENFIAPDKQHHGNGDGADRVHQGRADGLDSYAAQIGAEETAGGFLEAHHFPQLGIEGLHDAVAGHRFVKDVLDFCQLVLARAGTGTHFPADLARRGDDHGNEE